MAPTILGAYVGAVPNPYSVSVNVPLYLQGEDLPCRSLGPDLFFPDNYGLQNRKRIEEAKQACFQCPVFSACLDWAVTQTDLDGVWAATTPRERCRLRARTA
jgi:WhiB family redox-sensing transcriptional regulator